MRANGVAKVQNLVAALDSTIDHPAMGGIVIAKRDVVLLRGARFQSDFVGDESHRRVGIRSERVSKRDNFAPSEKLFH